MTAFEGNRVDLVCNATNDADANIPVQISWYNGTELIKPDGKQVVVNNVQNNVTGQVNSVLSFNPVHYTNDGDYICRAFNHPLSFTENKIKLTVECELPNYNFLAILYLLIYKLTFDVIVMNLYVHRCSKCQYLSSWIKLHSQCWYQIAHVLHS